MLVRFAFLIAIGALPLGVFAAEEEETASPYAKAFEIEVPSAVVGAIDGIFDTRLERREIEVKFETTGRSNVKRKLEKFDEKIKASTKALDDAVEQELRTYKKEVEKLQKKKIKLEDRQVKAGEDADAVAKLDLEITAIDTELEPVVKVVEAYEELVRDVKEVFNEKPKGESFMAKTRFAAPDMTFVSPEGADLDLGKARDGLHALVVFWSVRNKESLKVLQTMVDSSTDYLREGVKVIAIDVADPEQVFQNSLPRKTGAAVLGRIDEKTAKEVNLRLLPLVAFVTREGNIHSVFLGNSTRLKANVKLILDQLNASAGTDKKK